MEQRDKILEEYYAQMGIAKPVYDFCMKVEEELKDRFLSIDKTAECNQMKVLRAMQKNHLSEACFAPTTGYGYNDIGRETLEKIYADVFGTEDALVRPQITCGTHALALALMSQLRPGDELLSPVGKPYDTLEEVIGIRPSNGSLAEYGISYRQLLLAYKGETPWWIFLRMELSIMKISAKQSMRKQNWLRFSVPKAMPPARLFL